VENAEASDTEADVLAMALRDLTVERADPFTGKMFRLHVPAFDVELGARICLTGRSGSGKTTLLEILGLLAHPTTLERFDLAPFGDQRMMSVLEPMRRKDATTLSAIRARMMGFVLQDGGLLPYLTIRENALLAAELAGHSRWGETRQRITEVAKLIGMAELLDRLPAKLSGGERQRAAVLRSLAPAPRILLADEPTASLDPETSEEVLGLLTHTASSFGATVIMVSHNAPLAEKFGFQICALQTEETDTEKHTTLPPMAVAA
jgi:putative ABC transport system ATP-binding protein